MLTLPVGLVVTIVVLFVLQGRDRQSSLWKITLALVAGSVAATLVTPAVTSTSFHNALLTWSVFAPLLGCLAVIVWLRTRLSRRRP